MNQKLRNLSTLLLVFVFIWGCENATEPDTTPPQVSISSPVNNASVRDSVTIRATGADNKGIIRVEFLIDGVSISSVTKSPFEIQWDTKQVPNGNHNLQCKAVDNSGNETLSETVLVTVSNYLFKATFTNNWVEADEQCIIFISDMDGNVLSEKTFSGNESFEMFLDDGLNKSLVNNITKINVSTVVGNQYYYQIRTNLSIPVGASWTWKGYPSTDYENPNTVELNFQNVPEHEGYVLSSKWSYRSSASGTLSIPYSYNFYETPMDIYFKLNTINNGVRYVWLNDVVSGSRQDDLSNMINANEKTINMNGANGYRKYLYGISNPGHRYEGRYSLDYGYDNENSVNSVKVYYPDNSFTDYRTSLYLYDEIGNQDKFYYQSVYGDIPNTFTKINADFDFVNTSYDNFEISANGDFIEMRSSWSDDNYNYWDLYCDDATLKYKLPNLPNSVIQLFGLNRESFKLQFVDLIDHSELNSYSEIINILFNSDNYFYDVVNDFRARVKYYNNGGMLMKNSNELEFKTNYEESCLVQ